MDYSKTINLPETDFPMKANLAQREPEMLKRWEAAGLYTAILASRDGAPLYVLHDGPPYANGNIHMGHALNKILKDVIVKHKTMMGFRAPYVPGWDCHGLPIELHVTRELGEKAKELAKIDIRRRCRKYADKFVKIQMAEFKRLGVFGNYENPYLTMAPAYEAKIVETFGNILKEGFIYKSKKPIYWCPTCVTALAEAEVEYDNHTSPSIYVKFKVDPSSFHADGVDAHNLFVAIWTTTPWTLPANLAICFHPEFEYSVFRAGKEFLIMADGLAEQMSSITGLALEDKRPIAKDSIENLKVSHPFIKRESKVIFGDFVTLDAGTGIVHIAPGHGQEDYVVGLKYGIDTLSPVDDEGRFTDEYAAMKGENVFDANPKIVQMLKDTGVLIFTNAIEHSYPHCWRCKKPLIFRATEQWFMKIDHRDMRQTALAETDRVVWIPAWGAQRFRGMVESRPDWCLSRQRSWGVPIPSFRCKKCQANLMTAETVLHFAKLSLTKSIDAWYSEDIANLVPAGTTCSCGGTEFEKEFDILDVWFDSGVSHFAVLDEWKELRWPSDIYLEGSDQHRGWFQSSLWPAIALRQRAPYHTVLTHGFLLDDKGKAMSKSEGNVIHPEEIIKKYGADILRLWVSSEDYRNDVRIGFEMLNQVADSYRKIRNTFKFIIGNLSDFSPDKAVPYAQLADIDKWMLHKLYHLANQTMESYEKFEFHMVYRRILNFCAVELSSIYFDISKDILYIEAKDAPSRRSNQTVLAEVYHALVRLVAPVLSFTAEEIWQFNKNTDSIHQQVYHPLRDEYDNPAIDEKMERLVEIKTDALKALELKRKAKEIGTSLEAELVIHAKSASARELLAGMADITRFFQVSKVTLAAEKAEGMSEYDNSFIAVAKSAGVKCVRCWNYFDRAQIGANPDHPELCARCTDIITRSSHE
ncbi:MAG TPA: isoleucine--tRNA ligase [Spirochaetota bacterium]|nr:isoleucine--tRNA ligase [Spirochaetota bacterium]HPI22016.1 isoleucine--tRNA ligase [Spirochaetota bacterium]HPU89492.1 isoleucine--tRNA ligase [Spirochaetota bacterium]